MRRGNISNRVSPALLFNIDNLLFAKEISEPLYKKAEKLLYSISNNQEALYFSQKPNSEFVAQMAQIFHKSDYNVYMITFMPEHYKELYKQYMRDNLIPFTRIYVMRDVFELRRFVYAHRLKLHYYVDTDEETLSILGEVGVSYNNLYKIVK